MALLFNINNSFTFKNNSFTIKKNKHSLSPDCEKNTFGGKMSDNFVSKFVTAIVNAGIIPKNIGHIRAADRFVRIASDTDKGGKRSISYWLKVEGDFSYGYAKCFKTGSELRFNSAIDDPNMTRADLARVKALLRARKAEEDIRIAERYAKIATRAVHKWALCSPTGLTPYLSTKGVELLSARIYGERTLFIPIYEDFASPALISWQTIEADGIKKFPFGGKKGWHVIGQIDPTKPIVICEGWATGASIHMATGLAVVVAFDAGNLLPVSRAVRKHYHNTPIVIAADNDESGTGQKAAAKCQQSVSNVSIVMPKEIGHDFNDLEPSAISIAFGIQEGGGDSPIGDSQSSGVIPAAASWQNNIITDAKGRMVATSLQNSILYLLYHNDFIGVFAYDEFKQDTILLRCPPWEEDAKFKVESVSDIIITKTAATLERYGLSCTIDKAAKAIDVVAWENRFHSAREYLSALVWDGTPRLETFCQDYFGTKEEAPEYCAFVFKKWLTACVKRVMEPGCKFDHVLILESQKQGLYKSSFLKSLATFNGETYHTDSVNIDAMDDKDTTMMMQGNLIVELAELSGNSKKEDGQIKNWMTQTQDELRIPFSRKIVKYKRQFVFAATTNDYDYLRDPSGHRRFWPVTIEKPIDVDEIEAIKGQLWAEAVHWYKSKLYIGPTPEENELANIERAKRLQTDAWEYIVMGIVKKLGLDEFRTTDILERMDLKTTDKNDRTMRRISSILKSNGYNNDPQWDRSLGKSVRVWSKVQ